MSGPDEEALCHGGCARPQGQASQVGQGEGLVPLVATLLGDPQGAVEVVAGLADAALPPQTQGQQVVDHTPLGGAVCALQTPQQQQGVKEGVHG